MFTGIVQGTFQIAAIDSRPGLKTLQIEFSETLLDGLALGASVAVDGVCLTVAAMADNVISFDVMQETLAMTSLGDLLVGSAVNIERSAKEGVEIGGHIVSGHVDAVAEVVAIETPENNRFVSYRLPAKLMRFLFHKGFAALNGCSLTIAEIDRSENTITVCYIPETIRVTTHGDKQLGDRVNIEVDRQTQVMVETVENFLRENAEELLGTLRS